MTRQDVVSVLGPVDNATIAEIIASGASLEELREAWAWAFGDEVLIARDDRCRQHGWQRWTTKAT
ncbi:hypothetical protein [Mesorhizobium sp. 131-2-1]|uniref:hypothetical protein n=1 Tax=Mesorhizobium sp. 131-2-1 TaxID=2744518 RepID=UPI001936B693|nr:hypothetical protein MesoLj131a_56470 [Mesorhizobium sp. 131-2-1]